MSADRCSTLILGIGNILLRDEGVGVHVIEQMRGIDLPEGVELVDGGTGGADLLDVLAERKKVIVVDTVETDRKPGEVLRFGIDDLLETNHCSMSLHEIGLSESFMMARQLKCEPEEVVIFGVSPKSTECGMELSQKVSASIPDIIKLILSELCE